MPTRPAPTATPTSHRRLAQKPAFVAVAAVLGLALAASAVPSPLYAVYQAEWGFSSLVLTLVYAVYCFGVLAALLSTGGVSDRVGRRPVLIVALTGMLLSTVLFALAGSVAWLFAARLLQGVSTGVALGAASAALVDLHPAGDDRRVGLVNATVSASGMAAGALASGALVQYGPIPRVLPFLVVGVLFAITLAAMIALPEPVRERRRLTLQLQRPRVPPAIRGAFLLSALAVLASWSIGGIYLSLGPQLASELLHSDSHLAGGLAVLALSGPSVLTQLRWHRLDAHRAASAGAVGLALGMLVLVIAVSVHSPVLFFGGTAIAGSGFGIAFLGAMRSLTAVIPVQHRAEVMSAFYVVAYLALAVPAILAGLVVGSLGIDTTFRIFGSLVVVLALSVSVLAARVQTRTTIAAT